MMKRVHAAGRGPYHHLCGANYYDERARGLKAVTCQDCKRELRKSAEMFRRILMELTVMFPGAEMLISAPWDDWRKPLSICVATEGGPLSFYPDRFSESICCADSGGPNAAAIVTTREDTAKAAFQAWCRQARRSINSLKSVVDWVDPDERHIDELSLGRQRDNR